MLFSYKKHERESITKCFTSIFFLRPLIAHNVDSLVQKVNKNLPFGWLESISVPRSLVDHEPLSKRSLAQGTRMDLRYTANLSSPGPTLSVTQLTT